MASPLMADTPNTRAGTIEGAVDAAELVFHARKGKTARPILEPDTFDLARAAVDRMGELFEALPGPISDALDAAGGSAELLSTDRLQGLSEIVQNADDVEASEVRILLRRRELLVAHNGSPITLRDVHALAIPWLTTKASDSGTTGRFGIGLMTLRSLSPTLEVHCAPFHVRVGAPTLSAIAPARFPEGFADPQWTTVRIPLDEHTVSAADLEQWLSRWDDSALLFLRHVKRVVLLTRELQVQRELSLRWTEVGTRKGDVGEATVDVAVRRCRTTDARSWMIYTVDAPSPAAAVRTRKAADATTPIAVALPMQPSDRGVLYAGLPLIATNQPLWANAQFDPLASRQGLADTSWNTALAPLVADVWAVAILDLFHTNPRTAWTAVPLPSDEAPAAAAPIAALERLLLERARTRIAGAVSLPVPERGTMPLHQLAVEAPRLHTVLTPEQVAQLASLPAALPHDTRDRPGRWRNVLDDWRMAGAALPPDVDVADALALLLDPSLPVESTIALAAAAIDSDLGGALAELPCAVTEDGTRVLPPGAGAEQVLVAESAPLAEQMGIALRLHATHLAASHDARAVLGWLRDRGALLDTSDAAAVLRRLAAAGSAGRTMTEPLTDIQARALREAFEQLPVEQRAALGENVGRTVLLDGYHYDSRGRKVPTPTRPADAYLPKSIEKEPDGFAEAAGRTPGLVWIEGRYSTVLRSAVGRTGGVGALRFLRLLGAETAPRLRTHPDGQPRYSADARHGVPASTPGGPKDRQNAMAVLGATFTLRDHDSPDLQAVLADIAREKGTRRRRARSAALLSTLGRGWDRLGEFAEVTAALDYQVWNPRGVIRGFWLWQAGDLAWLDDADGLPRRPVDLRLRTPATIALYGAQVPGYLRPDLDAPNRRVVLAALGVTGEPTTAELVDRLRALRDTPAVDGEPAVDIATEAAVVYQALAERADTPVRGAGGMSAERLRHAFSRLPGLVHTSHGWRTPQATLHGPRIFGDRRAFVPAIPRSAPLWRMLRVPDPSLADAADVLTEMARGQRQPTREDQVVMLESLRLLAENLEDLDDAAVLRRLKRLPLWTTQGWVARPVYAIDDASLAHGLGDRIPVWLPGGGLEQFRRLFDPLALSEIRAADTSVVAPDAALVDSDATELLRAAVRLLRDDLSRNDQAMAGSLSVSWGTLEAFEVHVHADLSVIVDAAKLDTGDPVAVDAKVDTTSGVLFARDVAVVPRADGGGRALAGLFNADRRRVAQAWRAAWDEAETGRRAEALVLAQQQAAHDEAETAAQIEARTAALRDQIAARRGARGRKAPPAGSAGKTPPPPPPPGGSAGHPARPLVDPSTLRLRDPNGRLVGALPTGGKQHDRPAPKKRRPLKSPVRGGRPPRSRTGPAGYTGLTKETIALELVREVLAGDAEQIADLRAQHGVGADAIDELDQFYELKVNAGVEPDRVTLTDAEVQRALNEPGFFLVVVSGVEGARATPKVRVIVDPLKQLDATDSGSITLVGVRDAFGVVFDFERADSPDSA